MRGSIVKRSKTSWALVIDQGRDATGKRRQKWVSWPVPRGVPQREATKLAEAALAKLLHQVGEGTYVDASKLTLVEHLRAWHRTNVVPHRRPETARIYSVMIERHVAPSPVANIPIQKVRTSDLEHLYASVDLAPRSVQVLHAVIARALKIAARDRVIVANPAAAVEDRPRATKDAGAAAREHCWTADEARRFLAAAREAGAQEGAFFTLALDTGARRSELLGLTWSDLDLAKGTVQIARQLEPGSTTEPKWGVTKTGRARTVTLGAETIALLRAHKRAQAALKLANRTSYADHGLVFAKEDGDLQTPRAALGQPCPSLAGARFRRVAKAAGVRSIKFHGLRHTAATLALAAGVPVQVVAQRLGHAQTSMTLEVYSHVTPDLQADAAARLAAVLHGR